MRLRKPGLGVLGAAALALLPACKKDEPPASSAPQAASAHGAAAAPTADKAAVGATPRVGGGTLRGTVSFTGTPPAPATLTPTDPTCQDMERTDQALRVKEGRLENVVVRVLGPVAGEVAVPATPVVVDQKRCTYAPRVQGAVVGQAILIKNSDGTLHNVRAIAGDKPVFNVAQPPMSRPVERPLPRDAERLRLKCDIHPWMAAWVVLSPHPFFTVTKEDGAFALEHVPPGTYTLEAWHELLGAKTAEVKVEEGQEVALSFDFSAADVPSPATP